MANPHRGEVSFDVAGKTYTLSYSINALCELEEAADLSVNQVAALFDKPDRIRLTQARLLFWAGLRDHHPEVTVIEAGALMNDFGVIDALGLVAQAFASAFPEARSTGPFVGNRKAQRAHRASIGKSS